jgi:hypothetical protein
MRVICAGSPDWDRKDVVDGALNIVAKAAVALRDSELIVVHGACFPEANVDGSMPLRSADWLVEVWARRWNRYDLKVWIDRHPPVRGQATRVRYLGMLEPGADLVLAFVRGESESVDVLVELAERFEITTRVIDYDDISDAAEVSS